jgi:PAS domain S-box-containing protein
MQTADRSTSDPVADAARSDANRWQDKVELLNLGTWEWNLATGEVKSNDTRARQLGYQPGEVGLQAAWWDKLVHPADMARLADDRTEFLKRNAGQLRCRYRMQCKDLSWSWVVDIGCVLSRDEHGKPLVLSYIQFTILAPATLDEMIQQKFDRIRTAFDHTFSYCILLTPDGTVVEQNGAASALAASLKSESGCMLRVTGQRFWEATSWQHQPQLRDRLRESLERAAQGEFSRFDTPLRLADGSVQHVDFSFRPVTDETGKVIWIVCDGRDVTTHVTARESLRLAESRLSAAAEAAGIGLWEVTLATGEHWTNATFHTMLGYNVGDLSIDSGTFWGQLVHPEDRAAEATIKNHIAHGSTDARFEVRVRCRDGSWRWIQCVCRVMKRDANHAPLQIAGVHLDVTEKKESELRLAAAERLESVGKLASGVAHEINTPVQFVNDSTYFIRDAVKELLGLVAQAQPYLSAEASADLPYLTEHLPKAIDRSIDGLGRVAEIVRSMKEFAHPDQVDMTAVNINRAILSTLTVARNEYKYVAVAETQLSELPAVICHGGEINQVLLNLIVNAAHAIADVVKDSGEQGRITITTRVDGDGVVISVADTGGGIPEAIRNRIFEPFFTTTDCLINNAIFSAKKGVDQIV